jgi:YVTN family beta-propeller protein
MRDLEERLRGVDLVSAPDEWDAIEVRAWTRRPPKHRLAAALVALLVAIGSTVAVVIAFRNVRQSEPAGGLQANGRIVYVDAVPLPGPSDFENTDLFAFDPESGEQVNLTNTPTVAERSPVWSPDGTKVVYEQSTAQGEGQDLEVAAALVVSSADLTDARVIRRCEGSCGSHELAWSPDGTRLAWVAEERAEGGWVLALQVYELSSGSTTTLCDSRSCGWPGQPAWSSDGSRIAFSNTGSYRLPGPFPPSGPIWLADVRTGRVAPMTGSSEPCSGGTGETCIFDSAPVWSPDGSSIAFVRTTNPGRPGATTAVVIVGADGSDPRALSECASNDQCRQGPVAWSPDGRLIAYIDRYDQPVLHLVEPNDGADTQIPIPSSIGYSSNLLWSPDGTRLAFLAEGRRSDLFTVDSSTYELHPAASELTSEGDLAWLPEGAIEVTETDTLTVSPRVTATILVGSFPRDIAVGAGAVWVSVNDFTEGEPETHSVLRIDPSTNEIVATIPVGTAGNLAVGLDALWTIDSIDGPQDTVVRIDPATNQVIDTIPIGPYAFDVAVDASGVWVTRDFDGSGRSGEVIRIDPATNEIVARIPVDGRIRDVVVGEGGVWVVDSTSTLRRGPSLIHIDPQTNEVVATIPGLADLNVTTGGGLVWMHGWLSTIDPSVGTGSGDRPLVLRVDPATDQFVGDPIPMVFFHPFAFWEGGIWFVGEESAVSHLDAMTLEVDHSVVVDPIAQDSTVHAALDISTGTIWVANYQEAITRIDLK